MLWEKTIGSRDDRRTALAATAHRRRAMARVWRGVEQTRSGRGDHDRKGGTKRGGLEVAMDEKATWTAGSRENGSRGLEEVGRG